MAPVPACAFATGRAVVACGMQRRPFPWRKLTPTQIDLLERLAAASQALPYDKLEYRDLVVFEELRKLGFTDMRPKGRSKLEAVLTDAGRELRDNGYRTTRVVLRITEPQIALLRFLDDGLAHEESSGRSFNELPGEMIDVCRRMHIRGWVERYESWSGAYWSRLTSAGREVLVTIAAIEVATKEMAAARARGRLH